MFSSRVLLSAKSAAKTTTTAPVISPVVIRSLYRRLYREVSKLEADPMAKTLFPLTTDLQTIMGIARPLYVPGSRNYVSILRRVFRDSSKAPNVKLAFDTLTRLRAHDENVQAQRPVMLKEREPLVRSLTTQAPKHVELFRAEAVRSGRENSPRYVPSTTGGPSKVVLRDRARLELEPGTVLLAHPLSSTHVDRRVMIITERTPVMTSGVVLDLQFIFPISRGNPMFPEVFWGHEVYDGGFNQINLTMPPTAQVVVLHTLEPPTEAEEAEMQQTVASTAPSSAQEYVSSWLKWGSATAGAAAAKTSERTKTQRRKPKTAKSLERQHELLCQPIIRGVRLPNGEREPTLYVSKVEALPYLAKLAAGQPRSSLRVYWGSMRWTTSHIETEVSNGHWFPVKVSPSFFRSYDLAPESNLKNTIRTHRGSGDAASATSEECFPTTEDLAAAKQARERRHGVDVFIPQVFPAEGAIRRRECLWDEILFALGGEYSALVGGVNPFMLSSQNRNGPQILAPLLPTSTPLEAAAASAVAASAPAATEVATAADGVGAHEGADDEDIDELLSDIYAAVEHYPDTELSAADEDFGLPSEGQGTPTEKPNKDDNNNTKK